MNNRIDTVARARQLAAERNMPLSRLSRECGINHSTLAITRARGGQLQVDTIYKICDVLDISIADFFTVPEEMDDISLVACESLRIHNGAPSA
ncbi:MAG: helix-turn-helix transcriptional regulator [Acidaminococcaceae bacterium]|nr:helix-turn-helix transcriptional regulator [Acidaminococcaceae bacterium]